MTTPMAGDAVDLVAPMKLAMRRLGQGVSVLSTRHQGARIAMAATAVNSLSLDPPSMIVTVNRSASIFAALRAGAEFCVNILGQDQQDIAEACGGRLKGEERFGIGKWADDATPSLTDAQARVFCRQDGWMNYGSHAIFIGRVQRVQVAAVVAPLIYADGRYMSPGAPACE